MCKLLNRSLFASLVAMVGCGGSSGNNATPPIDAGHDTGMRVVDSGTDTGTPPIDAGGPADTGTDTGVTWSPSNVPPGALTGLAPVTLDIDVANLGGNCNFNTTNGTVSCDGGAVTPNVVGTQVTLSGTGGSAYVWVLSSLTVETGCSMDVSGSKPGILVVSGPVSIAGAVTTEAGAQQETNGGAVNSESGTGASATVTAGGGAFCGAGGNGVDSTGAGGTAAGGMPYGTPNLVPLLTGGAGGYSNGSGSSGGSLQISATGALVIQSGASINAAGQGGGTGNNIGGGGGAGGAILLESPSVSIAGTLAANGGSGGDGSAEGVPGNLGASPAAGAGSGGGNGSGGPTINGANGTLGTGADNGGGGGGAGWIRINTVGTPNLSGAIISPATTTSCYSVGAL